MGMYDSIWAKLKCPDCGTEKDREIQIKIGPNLLIHYYIGDTIEPFYFGDYEVEEEWHCQDCYDKTQDYKCHIEHIISTRYHSQDAREIQTRIANQNTNLLTAILYPNVPLTNNLAERQLRPMVVTRKISGGSRSSEGAKTHAVNMSIFQTIRMQQQPVVSTLKNLILTSSLQEL